jgi:hypothetical protein
MTATNARDRFRVAVILALGLGVAFVATVLYCRHSALATTTRKSDLQSIGALKRVLGKPNSEFKRATRATLGQSLSGVAVPESLAELDPKTTPVVYCAIWDRHCLLGHQHFIAVSDGLGRIVFADGFSVNYFPIVVLDDEHRNQ